MGQRLGNLFHVGIRPHLDAYLAPRDADSLLELRVAILVNRERAPTGGTISSQAVAPVTALLVTLLDPELLERQGTVLRHRSDRVVDYLQTYSHVLHVAINREFNLSGQDLARWEVRHVARCVVPGLVVVLAPLRAAPMRAPGDKTGFPRLADAYAGSARGARATMSGSL